MESVTIHEEDVVEATEDDPTDPITADGRSLRRSRNRDAVINALVALIREGDLDPTVAKIADRAEVSHRSIFRYFEDLNDLARTAVATEFQNVLPHSVIPDLGEGTLEHRINQIVAAQIRLFERTGSMLRVARAKAVSIPEIEKGMEQGGEFRAGVIRKQFDLELSQMRDAERQATVTSIYILLAFDGYDLQRRIRGASLVEIADVWRFALLKLLA